MPPISLPRGDGSTAYLARPDRHPAPWPGVVVIHELTGLNDDIRRQSDRLAEAGYLALAPDLFRGRAAVRCLRATFRALGSGHGPAVDDILAGQAWLRDNDECTGRVGIIGFCMGGGFALLLTDRGFDVCSVNYGPLPKDAEDVFGGACPIVASYGRKDRLFGDVPATLEPMLTELGVDHDVRLYPDAGHSFINRHRLGPVAAPLRAAGVGHHEASAEDAWVRILRFFDRHLRPEPGAGGRA